MRKVLVLKYAKDENGKYLHKDGKVYFVDDFIGTFQQYGIDYEELQEGVGNYSSAIVERDDGTVANVPLQQIRFLDIENKD